MRKTVFFLLSLLLTLQLCGPVLAYGGDVALEGSGMSCGPSLSWYVDGSTLYITGQGDMYDFPGGAPWAGFRYTISTVILSDGVTGIGAYAFQDYDYLSSVQFGSSLITIGAYAFSGCDGLTSISLPATFKKFGESSFRSCSALTSIYCSGNFPRFDQDSMWDTRATIFYPPSNPWPLSAIIQLESAFQNRIEFRCSDGTDPYQPTEATQATQPTEIYSTDPWTAEIWNTEALPTLSPAPELLPTETEPAVTAWTEPTETTVYTLPTVPTLPPQDATQPTEATILFGSQLTSTEPAVSRAATDGTAIIGVVLILLVLAILATGALLVRASLRGSRGGKYSGRR